MRLLPTVKIEAQLLIDDKQAEVLELLTSYDLARWFAEKCNRGMTAEQIRDVLTPLRLQLHRVIEARERALAAIDPPARREVVED